MKNYIKFVFVSFVFKIGKKKHNRMDIWTDRCIDGYGYTFNKNNCVLTCLIFLMMVDLIGCDELMSGRKNNSLSRI
jgi:hypothetical protein